ncbi:hypothetical protein [Zhihengliuella salsuginis]|uniref:Transcriptional regulator, AbiEi antitoxin, Type IV TA system n=1 Tax=Zhihengliuella salsuginis TaxID=578222 RepID=A0ABQ3GIS7_9MICC|nr:hypothetical protein [Zhihengliuella salsuginis]GHD05174.1 hypothetical protein GCM10008096_13730 [Zhihengliuella salsuginis]
MTRFLRTSEDPRRRAETEAVRHRHHTGKLLRLRPGIYFPAREWDAMDAFARYRVFVDAVFASTPNAVAGVETAALLNGLPVLTVPPRVVLRAPTRGFARTLPGRRLGPTGTGPLGFAVQYQALPPSGTRRLWNAHDLPTSIAVPPLAVTAVECAALLPWVDAVVAVEAALRRARVLHDDALMTPLRLGAALGSYSPTRQRRAARVLEFASAEPATALESFDRAVAALHGGRGTRRRTTMPAAS